MENTPCHRRTGTDLYLGGGGGGGGETTNICPTETESA